MFSGLVELGTGGEILPDVALSWEISEDGRRYVFHLREDVHWSDGQQVTAEDFEYSIIQLLDPKIESYEVRELFVVKNAKAYHQSEISDPGKIGVKALDPLTLEVELDSPASYFLYQLVNLLPIPKHVAEVLGESWADWEKIVTNGPFQPESIQLGNSILLRRNPNYHGRFPGNLKRIEIRSIPAKLPVSELVEFMIEMYELDRVDFMSIHDEVSYMRHQHAEEYNSEPIPGLYFFVFDRSRPPFDDPKVCKGFALALDKEKMAKEVPGKFQFPATGGFVPPGIPGHSSEIGLPYDPHQARQLLAEAGYPGGKGFPNLNIIWNTEDKILENILSQWMENLNIEVTLEIVGYEEASQEIRRMNLYFIGWHASILDPDNFLRVCIREARPSWRNETFDQLLKLASRTLDQGERIQLYQAADKILIEEAVVIPVYYAQAHYLVKPWVKIPIGRIGDWIFKDIIIEPHE
jgi:oligopeptide transport system substrate-binding protein